MGRSTTTSRTVFDPDAAAAPGSGVFGLPYSFDDAGVIVVPVPFEATTSYGGGTIDGPRALREASHQVDLYDAELGRVYGLGIHMLDEPADVRQWNDEAREMAAHILAAGGLGSDLRLVAASKLVNQRGEQVNEWVKGTVDRCIGVGKLACVVGGDHSVAFGAIDALAARYPGLGVLQLDAHADLRRAYGGFTWSHASIMYNVCELLPNVGKLVQVGIRDVGEAELEYIRSSGGRIKTHFDEALAEQRFAGESWLRQVSRIVDDLPQRVYLSFDIDGLEPTLCPHTGTPVPGGLTFQMAISLIKAVVRSGRQIIGMDLCEVAPGPAGDQWDGNVGARLLYKMIGWALRSLGMLQPL